MVGTKMPSMILVPISMALTMIGVHLNSAPILWMSIGFGLCIVCVGIINFLFGDK